MLRLGAAGFCGQPTRRCPALPTSLLFWAAAAGLPPAPARSRASFLQEGSRLAAQQADSFGFQEKLSDVSGKKLVTKLGHKDFNDFIRNSEYTLVEFYLPE